MTADGRCPECGASYRDHRVGLTFRAVRAELRSELWRVRVTRHTVLGRWREHKLNHWHAWHGLGRCVPDDATERTATP